MIEDQEIWKTLNHLLEAYEHETPRRFSLIADITRETFCNCCCSRTRYLFNKPIEQRIKGTRNVGIQQIISSPTGIVEHMGDEAKALIQWCVDYLVLCAQDETFQLRRYSAPRANGALKRTDAHFTSIGCFVSGFLNITQDSGYDDWLLTVLEINGWMEHGGDIRAGWLSLSTQTVFRVTDDHKQQIRAWVDNCFDENERINNVAF